MSFESQFNPEKNPQEELAVEEVKKIILEKGGNAEEAKFFEEMDRKNLVILESRPQTPLNRVFRHSRALMKEIIRNPQVLDRRPKFFHPKVGR